MFKDIQNINNIENNNDNDSDLYRSQSDHQYENDQDNEKQTKNVKNNVKNNHHNSNNQNKKIKQNRQEQQNYHVLYIKEKQKNKMLQKKIEQLEKQLMKLTRLKFSSGSAISIENAIHRTKEQKNHMENNNSVNKTNTKSNKNIKTNKSYKLIMHELKNFKKTLPNTEKCINSSLQNHSRKFLDHTKLMFTEKRQKKISIDQKTIQNINSPDSPSTINSLIKINQCKAQTIQPLIDCLALYGLNQFSQRSQLNNETKKVQIYMPQLLYCSGKPHQIVDHSTKLIYPKQMFKAEVNTTNNLEPVLQLLTRNIKDIETSNFKVFSLIFQPTTVYIPNNLHYNDYSSINISSTTGSNQQTTCEIDWEAYDAGTLISSLANSNRVKQSQFLNILPIHLINPQQRYYAFCIQYDDFDLIQNEKSQMYVINKQQHDLSFDNTIDKRIFEQDFKQFKKSKKSTQNCIGNSLHFNNNSLHKFRISKKVITIFTKYPFINFFQSFLTKILKQSFYQRLEFINKNVKIMSNYDFSQQIDFIKTYYQELNKKFNLQEPFQGKIGQKYTLQIVQNINKYYKQPQILKIQVNLSASLLKNYYAQQWAYPILSLFTLDNFLDVFTLITLEQKTIFVCENPHILTSTILLFTKILMSPFTYPYPTVSIIPNQYDYFNAPFPIVYGCLNNAQKLIKDKVTKTYKNVYVFMSPNGIEIHSHKSLSKVLNRKSARLRDKLLPEFIKMQKIKQNNSKSKRNQGLGIISWFSNINNNTKQPSLSIPNSKAECFNFIPNNNEISFNIITKIQIFLSSIRSKFPSKSQILTIKHSIQDQIARQKSYQHSKQIIDLQKQLYERVKTLMLDKTVDPFVQKFLETQIVAIQILK